MGRPRKRRLNEADLRRLQAKADERDRARAAANEDDEEDGDENESDDVADGLIDDEDAESDNEEAVRALHRYVAITPGGWMGG